MKLSQKQIILRHLREINVWVPSFKLRGIPTKFGFIGHQGDRRCRELAHEGKIQHKLIGAYVYYRLAPPMIEVSRSENIKHQQLSIL